MVGETSEKVYCTVTVVVAYFIAPPALSHLRTKFACVAIGDDEAAPLVLVLDAFCEVKSA